MTADIRTEEESCTCGLCGKSFTIVQTWEDFDDGMSSLRYSPEKIELLPDHYPDCKFVCADCQEGLQDKMILEHYDRDAWWKEIYIFTNLEKFYEDFPDRNWVREKGEYHYSYSNPPIYRILEYWKKGYPNMLRFTTEDKRIFDAIKDMPVVEG